MLTEPRPDPVIEVCLDRAEEDIREAVVFHDETLTPEPAVAEIEDAGDGRARGLPDAILLRIGGHRDEIGVAAPARPERWTERAQRPVLIAAAKQELCRPQTSCGEDHPLRHLFAGSQPAVLQAIEHDAVLTASRLDEAHQVKRPHLRPPLLGPWNVVDVQPVLRPDVAADVAVAKMNARALALPVCVEELA